MIIDRINSDCIFMLKVQIADRVLEIPGNCIGLLEATGINRILRKDIHLNSCYEVEGFLLEIHESRIAEIEFIKREMNKRHKKRISAIGIYYLEDDYTEWFDTTKASNKKQLYRITSLGDMRISLGTKIENYYTKCETSSSDLFGKYHYLITSFDRKATEDAEWRSYDEIIDVQTQEAMSIVNDLIKHTGIKLNKSTNPEKENRFILTLAITEQYILVVSVDKFTAVKMYDLVQYYWGEEKKEITKERNQAKTKENVIGIGWEMLIKWAFVAK